MATNGRQFWTVRDGEVLGLVWAILFCYAVFDMTTTSLTVAHENPPNPPLGCFLSSALGNGRLTPRLVLIIYGHR
jgi:hypothetical protein